ncbi:MAG: cupin domain-containing protein, partial [Akkermansiaceae bacterium]|nr:cupin domain-containing protein [Akkermansiaceae bacterium]NIS11591.1 cupin domain-containing protein [Thermoplasmata archaeon]
MKKKTTTQAPSCDWRSPDRSRKSPEHEKPKARIHRHRPDYGWSRARTERYKAPDGTWDEVLRRTLVGGQHGERTRFHLRYFEVAPGGHTTLETHRHEHVVVVIRGRGRCRIGKKNHAVGHLDTIYIPPEAEHQLSNPYDEPFG